MLPLLRSGCCAILPVIWSVVSAVFWLTVVWSADVAHAAAGPAGWQVWTPAGKRAAEFRIIDGGAIEITADRAVSFLYRPLDCREAAARAITWRWRVDAAPPPTDLERKGEDDRALALHVWYPADSDGTRSMGGLVAGALGRPAPGFAITYVWGGNAPRGALLRNPYMRRGALIVLRGPDAPLATSLPEVIEPAADFRRAFGREPPGPPSHVALSADSDDTRTVARGRIEDLHFIGAENNGCELSAEKRP